MSETLPLPGPKAPGLGGTFADAIRDKGERSGANAVSPKGAFGLMQVMPGTALSPGYGLQPSNGSPEDTERLGRDYANKLLEIYGHPVLASAAYNAGPGRVNQWLVKNGDPRTGNVSWTDWMAKIPFQETRDYVQRVNADGIGAGLDNSTKPGPRVGKLALDSAPGQSPPQMAQLPNLLSLMKEGVSQDGSDAIKGVFDPKVLALRALTALLPGTHKLQAVDYNPYAKGLPNGRE